MAKRKPVAKKSKVVRRKTRRAGVSPPRRIKEPSGYLKLRLSQVSQWIVAFRNLHLVKDRIIQDWRLTKRRAEQYIRMVFDIWTSNYEERIVGHAVRAIADREEIIRLSLKLNNYRTALRAMDSRDRILGVLVEHVDLHSKDAATLAEAIRSSRSGGFARGSRIAEELSKLSMGRG